MSDDMNKTVTVLFVDDEENILRSLQRLVMDEEDVEIFTALSGEEGLEKLSTLENVALIVSDQRMPGMMGAQFLEKAREIVPDASRVILTGYADVSAAVDAINKGGAWRYLAKPWNEEELMTTIREGISRYRMLIENRRLNELVAKQNKELEEWNANLKQKVLAQTTDIRKKSEELMEANLKLKMAFNNSIKAFSELMNLRDSKARLHSSHVREMAEGVARDMKLDEHEKDTLVMAAMLHDIGEIGIPEHVLAKHPSSMGPDDLATYRKHPVRGQAAIDTVESLREIGVLIRHHHENYDGSGFPDGLKGDDIPLGARIIAYADFIDKAMEGKFGLQPLQQVLVQASMDNGRRLDPKLHTVFKRIAKYTYFDEDKALHGDFDQTMVEVELRPESLQVGLKVSQDVFSGTGLLLLKAGSVLDSTAIASLERYYQLDPPGTGVFVLSKL